MTKYITTLTIAGSDCSGGAGIEADIKAMSAIGCYAAAVITAVTVQNTRCVGSVHIVPPDVIYDQIRAVTSDLFPICIKTGMLADVPSVMAVADALKAYKEDYKKRNGRQLFIVADPVMVSSSGQRLMSMEAVEAYKKHLLPLVTLLTPNQPEAYVLTGVNVTDTARGKNAARCIMDLGAENVLLKGGHVIVNDVVADTLYEYGLLDDNICSFVHPKVVTRNTHGTGCTLSSAICALMAVRNSLDKVDDGGKTKQFCDALSKTVAAAEDYMYKALKAGAGVNVGEGYGPVNHFFDPKSLIKINDN